MIVIKEAPQTDLVYYSRLSDDVQNKVSVLRNRINELVEFINDNSEVLVTLNDDTLYDYNPPKDYSPYDFIDEFENYLDEKELEKKYVGRSDDYYIRDSVDNSINDFLYELEDTEINFNTVCVAIETAYLTYDEYYSEMLDNNLEETAIDEIIKNDIMSGLDERTVLNDITTAIQELYNDVNLVIKDVKSQIRYLTFAYTAFEQLANEVSKQEKI